MHNCIEWTRGSLRSHRAKRDWGSTRGKNLYFHFYLFLFIFFSIEFFEGVSKGGPYRWSMDRSVRWSVFSGHLHEQWDRSQLCSRAHYSAN